MVAGEVAVDGGVVPGTDDADDAGGVVPVIGGAVVVPGDTDDPDGADDAGAAGGGVDASGADGSTGAKLVIGGNPGTTGTVAVDPA